MQSLRNLNTFPFICPPHGANPLPDFIAKSTLLNRFRASFHEACPAIRFCTSLYEEADQILPRNKLLRAAIVILTGIMAIRTCIKLFKELEKGLKGTQVRFTAPEPEIERDYGKITRNKGFLVNPQTREMRYRKIEQNINYQRHAELLAQQRAEKETPSTFENIDQRDPKFEDITYTFNKQFMTIAELNFEFSHHKALYSLVTNAFEDALDQISDDKALVSELPAQELTENFKLKLKHLIEQRNKVKEEIDRDTFKDLVGRKVGGRGHPAHEIDILKIRKLINDYNSSAWPQEKSDLEYEIIEEKGMTCVLEYDITDEEPKHVLEYDMIVDEETRNIMERSLNYITCNEAFDAVLMKFFEKLKIEVSQKS